MLTRRDIRVKVMQALYSAETANKQVNLEKTRRDLIGSLDNAKGLPAYFLLYIVEMTGLIDKTAAQKAQKYLPSESDLTFDTKLAESEIISKLLENNSFKEALKEFKTKYLIDKDMVRHSFDLLLDSEPYQAYIKLSDKNTLEDKKIFRFIFDELMLQNEDFIAAVEKEFIHYLDDIEPAIVIVNEAVSHPSKVNFMRPVGKEKMGFAIDLLTTVVEKSEYCLELIEPKLRNWDAERIAAIDMILLKMGLCEILFFDTIPAKVTINEYIELAKEYSTERSGNFVNGILDNLYKDLNQQRKIRKVQPNKNIK